MIQYKWDVTIKYTHHPFLLGGETNFKDKVSNTWWTTIYDNGKKLTASRVKDEARKQFLNQDIAHLAINQIRVTGKQPY